MVLYFTTTLDNQADTHRSNDIMLRINRTRQFRVSNRMAVMAALLLVVTAAGGLGDRFDTAQNAAEMLGIDVHDLPRLRCHPKSSVYP